MRFADIIGQQAVKAALAKGAGEGRISHAQLFSGRSGYGALPLAVAYAQYINCTDRAEGDSCGRCPSCLKISALAHPDLHFAYPVNSPKGVGLKKPVSENFLPQWRELFTATGGYFGEQDWYGAIDIENQQGIISRAEADEIIRKLSFKSFEAAYKVMVVWLPERMRTEAANSLLKILEEPWDRTVFLLVSESPARLLPTILSRVQEIALPAIGTSDMEAYLSENFLPGGGNAATLARLSGGDIIEARRLAGEGIGEDTHRYFELFAQLMRLSYNDRHMELLEWGETVAAMGREEQKRLLQYAAKMIRDNYMLNAGMRSVTGLWGEELAFSEKFSPFIGNHNVEKLAAEIDLAIAQISQNGNPKIIFPHFALAVSKLIVR